MSFLSDLFEGNTSQLGGDLTSPSAIQEFEIAGGALGGALLGGAALGALPELGALGGTAAADLGATGAIDLGAAGAADLTGAGALGGLGEAAAIDPALAAAGGAVADPAAAGLGGDLLSFAGGSGGGTDFLAMGASDTLPSLSAPSLDLSTLPTDSSGFLTQDIGAATPDTTATAGAATGGTTTTAPATGGTVSDPTGLLTGTNTPAVNTSTTGAVPGGTTSGGTVSGMGGSSAGSGGVTGTLNSILSSPFTKLAVGAAPLVATLAMGEQQLPQSAQQLQGQALALQQTGLNNLSQAQQGVMNAGQTAQLAQMRADLTNQWLQVLKNQGVQDPTKDARWPQIQAAIDGQVTQQTQTFIQQNIQNALAETGQASTALTQIANMQMTADQQFTNNLVNATKSLGVAAGSTALPKITIG